LSKEHLVWHWLHRRHAAAPSSNWHFSFLLEQRSQATGRAIWLSSRHTPGSRPYLSYSNRPAVAEPRENPDRHSIFPSRAVFSAVCTWAELWEAEATIVGGPAAACSHQL